MNVRPACIAALLVAVLSCHGGQSREYLVAVDALLGAAAGQDRTYYILPGIDGVDPGDLEFQEYSAYVHRVLRSRGFKSADAPTGAEIAIFFSYGIGQPQVTYTSVSYPIYGMVSSGNTSTVRLETSAPGTPSTTTTGTVRTGPQYGVVGTGTRTESYVEYHRYIRLSAIDVKTYRETGRLQEVWRTTVRSTGTTGDLRRVMPVLVAAARNAIATSSGYAQEYWIREDDKRVEYVRGATQRAR